jgi:hypothetical protein
MPLARFARRALLALSLTLSLVFATLDSGRALARPPYYGSGDNMIEPVRPTLRLFSIPPSVQAVLRRMGGERAVRMAHGVPAGKHVTLRPMFWVTREHAGAMFALGGLF